MGPILRRASGPIRVPADLPLSARWVLEIDGMVECLEAEADQMRGSTWHDQRWADRIDASLMAIKRLAPLWWYSEEFIAVDGEMLSDIRNRCYETALNDECQGIFPDGSTGAEWPCYECGWCYCWVMLHRIDHWLDRAGSPKSAYIDDIDWDVEAEWLKCWY